MIVAIDGPAGAGKSSVSAAVAERLGFQLIDTGALYRCVALRALERSVALDDADALAAIAAELDVRFAFRDGRNRVLLDGVDVNDRIRNQTVSDGASRVSALAPVRAALLDLQRSMGRAASSVMEGRDIGTVVFPDAEVKVYLTASLDERGRRRLADYERAGRPMDIEAVTADIAERDARDMARETAPLKRADDAIELDTTGLSFEQVVDRLVAIAKTRGA
jgi:cytidylate kinase